MTETFQHDFAHLKTRIDEALTRIVRDRRWPNSLKEAVNYSLLAGGKRLRPVLTLMAARVCSDGFETAVPAACAVEMIHTYSLIHDDLPSMDDDELRRGRPTSHVVFGEPLAILAGDALLTLAFESLASADLTASACADCTSVLAKAAGGAGMVGGQVLDLEAERGSFGQQPRQHSTDSDACSGSETHSSTVVARESQLPASEQESIRVEHLIQIHRMKTGALITAALEMGAVVAEAGWDERSRLVRFGQCIGLAFQIADDLLDVTGSDASLGKQAGRDRELGKLTYPSLLGVDGSRQKAAELIDEAHGVLDVFRDRAEPLRQLARFIVERDH